MINGSLMKAESIAECSPRPAFQAIIGIKNQFWVFFLSGRLRQVLLYASFYIIMYWNSVL